MTDSPAPLTIETPLERVVVTGATGFIGRALVAALSRHRTASGRPPEIVAPCRIPQRAQNLFSAMDPAPTILTWGMHDTFPHTGPIDAVVHLAGTTNPVKYAKEPAECLRRDVLGCVNILAHAVALRAKRFVLASSGEAYGNVPGDGRITENDAGVVDPQSPRSCYPLAKQTAESLTLAYGRQYGLSVSIVRMCHVYGPGMNAFDPRIAVQFPLEAMRGRNIVIKSSGAQRRSFCYIDDVVAGLLTILTRGGAGELYNVADENAELTVRAYAEKALERAGHAGRVVFGEAEQAERERFNPMPRAVFSSAKLRALGWRPAVGIDEGMDRTLEDLRRRREEREFQ